MEIPTDSDREIAREIMRSPLVDGFGDPDIPHTTLVDRLALALAETREKAAGKIPTSWLDKVFTDIGGSPTEGCPYVERLLRHIAAAIRKGEA